MTDQLPAHSALGASGSSRWFVCHASAHHAANAEEREQSSYALEGSRAHELGEEWLTTGKRPDSNDWEMLDAVEVYVDFVKKLAAERGARLFVEQKFRLTEVEQEIPMFGTADAVIWNPSTRTLHIVDYKHGIGVPVHPYENSQLLYYALGAWYLLKRPIIDKLRLTIVQPRSFHKSEPVQTWEPEDGYGMLLHFESELMGAVERVTRDPWRYEAGPHCQFCIAAGACEAHMDYALEGIDMETPPGLMKPKAMREALLKAQRLRIWLKRVSEEGDALAQAGKLPPGMKLVAGRKVRVWRDEDEARERLTELGIEEIDEVKLISPAEVEKQIGAKAMEGLNDLIDYRQGKPQLVDASDFREAVGSEVDYAMKGI